MGYYMMILVLGIQLIPINHIPNKRIIEFWDVQRKGANCFNEVPTETWFSDANDLGIEWVRLTYDKWSSLHRDFLLGDASNYQGLITEDLLQLKQVIRWAEKYDIKLVITPLSLPGCRYRQNNNFRWDTRLWDSCEYWEQSVLFWTDLVSALKEHKNIVAYNIINEPCPEFGTGLEEHIRPGEVSRFLEWYDKIKGTPRDIYQFYLQVICAIKKINPDAVIMLDAGWYGQPGAFCYWPEAFGDPTILYSFHMYEPYAFTSHYNFTEKKNFIYPGNIPFGIDTIYWDYHTIADYFEPFLNWTKLNNIPSNRIVAGEFGCMRKNEGVSQYLRDIIDFLNYHRFHWAFYSFREDEWDGYDYELGTENLDWNYWQAKERGESPELPRRNNPIFEIIKQEFEIIK